MFRCLFASAVLLLSGIACVSTPTRPIGTEPLRNYSVARPPQRRLIAPLPQPRRPVARTARSVASAWRPRRGRISPRWTHIVLHHSATDLGGARRFDKFHREVKHWDELGYHFVIGNGTDTADGYVEVGSRWHKQKTGAHCKTRDNYFNDHGIGICLVGDFTKSRPTAKQMASLVSLVRFLSRACDINPANVTTHGAVTGKTQCPGHNFHVSGIRRALTQTVTATSMR